MDINPGGEWHVADQGQILGTIGPDGGVVLRDQLYGGGAHITLERDRSSNIPYGIVCAIDGWMVHTRYFSDLAEANEQYDEMQHALVRIAEIIPNEDDPEAEQQFSTIVAEIKTFIKRYP